MVIDGLFAVLTYLAFHLGHKRGLVAAAFGFFGWLLALVFALKLTPWGAGIITSIIRTDLQVNPLIAFVILLGIGWTLVQKIGNSSEEKVDGDDISIFNSLAGGALYWVAFMLTFSLALKAADNYKVLPPVALRGSRTYPQMLVRFPDMGMKTLVYIIPYISDSWNILDHAISGIGDALEEGRPEQVQPTIVEPQTGPEPTPEPSADDPLPSILNDNGSSSPRKYDQPE